MTTPITHDSSDSSRKAHSVESIVMETAEKICYLAGYGGGLHPNDIIPDIRTALIHAVETNKPKKSFAYERGLRKGIKLMNRFDVDSNGCWVWNRNLTNKGYARDRLNEKNYYIHRLFYEVLVKEIPKGKMIDHLCRNAACVNPKHLEPVSNKENILRGVGISAQNARKTHCKNGHELSGDNLSKCYLPVRICRICRSKSQKIVWKKRYYGRKALLALKDKKV